MTAKEINNINNGDASTLTVSKSRQGRKFQFKWPNLFLWLEYSIKSEAAKSSVCVLTSLHQITKMLDTLSLFHVT
jgi:hypothetical protein